MKPRLVNTNPFPLAGTGNRFLHLASISRGLREYMCFIDLSTEKIYVEEITGASLSQIKDSELLDELESFLQESGILVARPWQQIRELLQKGTGK